MSEHKHKMVGKSSGIVVSQGNSFTLFRRPRLLVPVVVTFLLLLIMGLAVVSVLRPSGKTKPQPEIKNQHNKSPQSNQVSNPQSESAKQAEIRADQPSIDAINKQPTVSKNPDVPADSGGIVQLPVSATGGSHQVGVGR